MKNTFTLFLLFGLTTLFGQNLKFDVMVKYSVKIKDIASEFTSYGISSNENYLMKVLNQYDGQIAEVFDVKSFKKHSYRIVEAKLDNGETTHIFEYIDTKAFILKPNLTADQFSFESISKSNDIEKVNLISYKNKSKTKVNYTLELTLLKSEINFFHLFRFSCLDGLSLLYDLTYKNPGLVTSCYSKEISMTCNLVAFEEVNLELKLPN